MTLALLGIGLLAYTAAVVKCASIERDYQWRKWIENFRPKYGPDGRDRYGMTCRQFEKQSKRRTEEGR